MFINGEGLIYWRKCCVAINNAENGLCLCWSGKVVPVPVKVNSGNDKLDYCIVTLVATMIGRILLHKE